MQQDVSEAPQLPTGGSGVRVRHRQHPRSENGRYDDLSPTNRSKKAQLASKRNGRFYQTFCMPQLWSLSFLMVLTFAVASACSFLVNTAAFLCLSPLSASSDFPPLLLGRQSLRGTIHGYYAPRVFHLEEETWFTFASRRRHRVIDLDFPLSFNTSSQALYHDGFDEECVPMADWQTASFPTCNTLHEINLLGASELNNEEEQLSVLGEGWFRTTWMLNTPYNNETTVLKTLRTERDFSHEFYELHRRDAVAMERLTSSKFIVDVYGYCGNSAINEMADFPYVNIRDLEKFDRRLRGMYDQRIVMLKLHIAASIAQGVADMHSIDGLERGATMVHYDLNPRNIALFKNGKPKINDFNIAEFLRYNPKTNKTCGFPNRMHQPWWRAPEEVSLTAQVALGEKVDVYSLGAILFHILTTHAPRGKMKPELMEGVRDDVLQGILPVLPEPFASDKSMATMAFRKAMDRCFIKDPAQRASAQEILEILTDALAILVNEDKLLKNAADRNAIAR